MMPIDELEGDNAFEVTPNDSTDLTSIARVIRVGAAGNLKIMTSAGNVVTLKNCYVGEILNYVRIKRVYATGTTAADLVGFW